MSLSVPPMTMIATLTAEQLSHLIAKEIASKLGQREQRDAVYTTAQVARRLGMHPKTVTRLVRLEGLPAHRISGSKDKDGHDHGEYRFRWGEVEAWIAQRGTKGGA